MKSPLTTLLVGLLAGSVLLTMALCAWCVRTSSRLQGLHAEAQHLQALALQANRNRSFVQSMVSDAVEYSQKDPAILPVLRQLNIKVQPNPAAGGSTPSNRR